MKPILSLLLLLLFSNASNSQIVLESTTLTERTVVTNLDVPWDMTYGSDGWIWFTEVAGNIKRFHPDTEELESVFTIPDVNLFGFGAGLHSIVLHPNFMETSYVYVHYLNSETTSKIVRYTFDEANTTLIEPLVILSDINGGVSHNGSRMIILDDKLLIPIGDGYDDPDLAQDLNSINGNFLRMNLDGSVPIDNPIEGSYIWSWGHRNPQGFCVGNGLLYSSEHGTTIDDEINIIQENRNYGWPDVEGFCDTQSEMNFCETEDVVEPIWAWTPSIAPCGLEYFDHESIPEWQNSLLLVTLKDKSFIQLKLSEDGLSVMEENKYLVNTYGRLRDVLVLPDGRIFICTTNRDFFGNPISEDDRIIEIKNTDFTDIDELDVTQGLHVYPNPTDDGVYLEWPGHYFEPTLLTITDLNGQVVLEREFNGNDNKYLSTASLPNGAFMISLSGQKQTFVQKIIVSH